MSHRTTCRLVILQYAMSAILVSVAVATMVLAIVWRHRRRQKIVNKQLMAPAVAGSLPWLGNVLNVDRQRPHITLTDWYFKLGPVYRYLHSICLFSLADQLTFYV